MWLMVLDQPVFIPVIFIMLFLHKNNIQVYPRIRMQDMLGFETQLSKYCYMKIYTLILYFSMSKEHRHLCYQRNWTQLILPTHLINPNPRRVVLIE